MDGGVKSKHLFSASDSGRYFAECNKSAAVSVRETGTWQSLEMAVHEPCEINVALHGVGFWVDGSKHPSN